MYQFYARPFEGEDGKIRVLAISRYVIVAVYFVIFESVIVYRNTRRPCDVSKRAYYGCRVREF